MLKAKQRITSILVSCCMLVLTAVLAVSTLVLPTSVTASAATTYQETSFGEGKILITTTFNGATYYLPTTYTSLRNFTRRPEIGTMA